MPSSPGVPEGADLLRLAGQILVLAVGDLAPVDEGLEVGAVTDAIRRIEISHLHPPAETFLLDQAVHHQQAVASDQPVGPVVAVFVELDCLAEWRVFIRHGKQRWLCLHWFLLAHRLDNGARVEPFVDMK